MVQQHGPNHCSRNTLSTPLKESKAYDELLTAETQDESETESDGQSSSLERTASQVAAHVQILGVHQRLNERTGAVHEIQRAVETLSCEHYGQAVQSLENKSDTFQKQARNLGEDLLEDLLALDKLSGLTAVDRAKRKAAIARIETLLESVDATKTRLVGLNKQLHVTSDAVHEQQGEIQFCAPQDGVLESKEKQESSPAPPATRKRTRASPREAHYASDDGRLVEHQIVCLPDRDLWKDIPLRIEFQVRQERGSYAMLAAIPRLNAEDLEIVLSDDRATLSVSGLCVPTDRQAEQMRDQLVADVQHSARTMPERFREISGALPRIAQQTYAKLGHGRFGAFCESFRVPPDVDIQRIKASFEDGVLCVALPRRVRYETPPTSARRPFRYTHGSRLFGHPSFGW